MRAIMLGLLVISVGCGGSGPPGGDDDPIVPADPLPTTSGTFVGNYRVPVADAPELEAAASYPVAEVHWTLVGNTVTLDYHLPDGLVGGLIGIDLSGPLAAGATQSDLAGDLAIGTCVAKAQIVTCAEDFGDLGVLPISMAVVDQAAAREYTGPVADRRAVAQRFSTDPIGILEIDFARPVVDDHGGGP